MMSVCRWYGAMVYNTLWRHHIVPPAILTTLFICSMLYLFFHRFGTKLGNTAYWLAIGSIVLAPVGFFGLYEGAYNHVLKDVLYLSGASESTLHQLFPPPTYEMPNNLFFEATGIPDVCRGPPWPHIPLIDFFRSTENGTKRDPYGRSGLKR